MIEILKQHYRKREIGAIILAAGFSTRMQAFKPLLPLGTVTVIERTLDSFQQAGFERIWVVTGHRGAEIEARLADRKVVCVHNEHFQDGMFSSLQAGVQELGRDLQGFFVMPADMPLVQPTTLRALGEAFEHRSNAIFYPVCHKRRGHPPLLSMQLADRILAWHGDGGLRAFLKPYQDTSVEVPVADEGVLLDLDHQGDYLAASAHYGSPHKPYALERPPASNPFST
jgi:CTP:molybdopterin cytidylyltransferase MocA